MRVINVAAAQLGSIQKADELLVHPRDLDATNFGKQTIFNFANHRRIEHYGLITSRIGAVPPPEI